MSMTEISAAATLQRSLTIDFRKTSSCGRRAEEKCVEQTCASLAKELQLRGTEPRTSPPASPFCTAAAEIVRAFEAKQGEALHSLAALPANSNAAATHSSACGMDTADTDMLPKECFSSTASNFTIGALSSCSMMNMSSVVSGLTACCPPHGIKAVCGKRSKMEDAWQVQPNFFELPLSPMDDHLNKLPARIATQLDSCDASSSHSTPMSPTTLTSDQERSFGSSLSSDTSTCDTLHFFGVYDGHGGTEAAQHCANRLHHHLGTALASLSTVLQAENQQCFSGATGTSVQVCQAEWTVCSDFSKQPEVTSSSCAALDMMKTSCCNESTLSDAEVSDTSSQGSDTSCPSSSVSLNSLLEEALKDAFLKTDAEFAADGSASMVGSTAVVALLGSRKMWLANCGDSRAVLCRGGRAIQLTDDHKPEREDEAERVEKAGGQVLFWNGHRVMGVLAMSRAIGDHGLRPYVIPEPEITVVSRSEDDDFLLMASDGLWDVMANQEATNLAIRCMARAWDKGASRKAAVRIAASVLTKAAIDRGSKDNVTVVIVDLKTPKPSAQPEGDTVLDSTPEFAVQSGAPTCACSEF